MQRRSNAAGLLPRAARNPTRKSKERLWSLLAYRCARPGSIPTTRTSGSVGGQGQQRPWSTRPGPIHTAAQVQQRRLAAAGRPHDRHELAGPQFQADPAHGVHGAVADPVSFTQVLGPQHRHQTKIHPLCFLTAAGSGGSSGCSVAPRAGAARGSRRSRTASRPCRRPGVSVAQRVNIADVGVFLHKTGDKMPSHFESGFEVRRR